jgi:Ca2+-binding RTX toxin-like protein
MGGDGDDTFVWSPGDDNDLVDGGPGDDTIRFNGANVSEIFAITADGTGFDLSRNIANILMEVENAEVLVLTTFGGDDDVSTTSLPNTTQFLTAAPGSLPDTLRIDAAGHCLTRQGDTFEVAGRPPIHFVDFPAVFVSNAFCPCDAAATLGCRVNGVRNQPCQGTAGDDVIVGTGAADVIKGGGGHDQIRAGSGDDLVCGEEGDDRIVGASGGDTLVGGPGADDLSGGGGDDEIDGGPGDDRLRGGGDLDTLHGGTGVDEINGGGGNDLCTDSDQAGPFVRCELP